MVDDIMKRLIKFYSDRMRGLITKSLWYEIDIHTIIVE